MFIMFWDCASRYWWRPLHYSLNYGLKPYFLKQPAGGASYYARRFPKLGHHNLLQL